MRPYHSPSSIALGARCQRAWAYRYIAGLAEPELSWADIEAGRVEANSRQRALALGKAVHGALETWYQGTPAPIWLSRPGQIAMAGIPHLPAPDQCQWHETERAVGDVPTGLVAPRPMTGLRIHGVLWAGSRDLLAMPSPEESDRLGLPHRPILIDYKTSSDVAKWGRSTSELEADVQASVYVVDAHRVGIDPICRWVYLQTRGTPKAAPVDFELGLARALAQLEGPSELARELDRLESVGAAPANTSACVDYLMPGRGDQPWQGGCPFHISAGGPCEARRACLSFVRLRSKLDTERPRIQMTEINPEVAAKFRALTGAPIQAEPPAAVAPPAPIMQPPAAVMHSPVPPPLPAEVVEAQPSLQTTAAPPAEPKRRGRPPRATVGGGVVTSTSADTDEEDQIVRLARELVEARAEARAATERFESLRAELGALCCG